MTTGTCWTPRSSAGSWTAGEHCRPPGGVSSGEGMASSGWTRRTARGWRARCPPAGPGRGALIIATTGKMLVWFAQVTNAPSALVHAKWQEGGCVCHDSRSVPRGKTGDQHQQPGGFSQTLLAPDGPIGGLLFPFQGVYLRRWEAFLQGSLFPTPLGTRQLQQQDQLVGRSSVKATCLASNSCREWGLGPGGCSTSADHPLHEMLWCRVLLGGSFRWWWEALLFSPPLCCLTA